ncbi:MAG: TrmH family RNA methyltransferase [Actinomycetota bacterium]
MGADKEPIASPANPLLKRARKLRLRKHRDAEGVFLVEGIAPTWQALEHADVEVVLYSPGLLTSDRALDLVRRAENSTRVVAVTPEAFATLSEREHPVGLAAIAHARTFRLRDLVVEPDSVFIALHEIGSPGNLGTIVRTADAAGAAGVIALGEATDFWHPSALKSSMGTVFTIPLVVVADPHDVITWARDHGLTIVTTTAHTEIEHWSTTYSKPALLLFGSEGHGLDAGLLDEGDVAVRIPMYGTATSLNLAVAVGILTYEATRPESPPGSGVS